MKFLKISLNEIQKIIYFNEIQKINLNEVQKMNSNGVLKINLNYI